MFALLWPVAEQQQVTSLTVPLPATPSDGDVTESVQWHSDKVRSGDSLSTLFTRNNLSAVDVIEIASVAPKDAIRLYPGQQIRWTTDWENRITAIELPISPLAKHTLERSAEGGLSYQLIERDAERVPRFASATIDNSLFLDGERAGVPESTLIELAGIFGWDIDFAMDIRKGDSFSLIYDEIFLDGEKIGNGDIQVARFVNQGREITAVRYEDKNGNANYYTPDGISMRKEFLRNPIDFFRISSRFNLQRKHPIYNTIRAHKGTDYAAPTGTPVKAVGDGKVIYASRKGTYGNLIIIKHNARYETRYAHLNAFNRSVKSGRYVKQGQVIGYVGSTGAATGPHLHYEFRVDGVFRDSLKFAFPQAQSISSADKPAFLTRAKAMETWLDGNLSGARP
ncbi:M23 family metallopeptidase [Oceanobacter mangrovi]|uniref:M23 family metallopeptidase n=1 Tax=Oceanobacter mangrovi TaxID=2862510 RepID=UPI001FE3CE4F|nr:peptidoglycan DD-metalloendopeptidase family protein [Oceanobacter mangrovi]